MIRYRPLLHVFPLLLITASALAQEPKRQTQPVDPRDAQQQFAVHPDCRVELVASEPNTIDPVAMTFAADGRLWVVEYGDYPNGPKDNEPGQSRIRVLEDTDSDGVYDQSTVFARNLLFANGLMLWKDGVIVTTDGKVLFLRDTNGDQQADETQVWFQGFATENPQLRCNHPTLGIDNFIYISNGLRGGAIVPGESNPWGLKQPEKPLSLSGMDFRFNPFTGEYEAISGMGQFGLAFDDLGNRFTCDNRHPCKQIILKDEWLKSVPWLRVSSVFHDVSAAGEASRLYPLSRTWTTSNLHANQFTAACGVTIYRGSALPEAFAGNSFTCEPTANLIHRDILTPKGITFDSVPGRDGTEFLATKDEWFRPVNLAHGPGGGLYICDMYRAVIEHPQFMPTELKSRPDLLLGTDRGRIWVVLPKEAAEQSSGSAAVSTGTTQDLIALLKHSNVWQRETAHRLLLERQDATSADVLRELLADASRGAANALWLLDGLGQVTLSDVQQALKNPSARIAALHVGAKRFAQEPGFASAALGVLSHLDSDKARRGQLAAHLIVSVPWTMVNHQTEQRETWKHLSLELLLAEDVTIRDWSRPLVAISAGKEIADCALQLLPKIAESRAQAGAEEALRFFGELVARRNEKADAIAFLSQIFSPQLQLSSQRQLAALGGCLEGAPGRRTTLLNWLAELPEKENTVYQQTLDQLVESAKQDPFPDHLTRDIPLLTLLPAEKSLPLLRELVEAGDAETGSAAVAALSSLSSPETTAALVELLPRRTPQIRRQLIASLATSPTRIPALLDEVEAGRISPLEVDQNLQRTIFRQKDAALRKRAQDLLKQEPPEDRQKVLREYQSVLSQSGNPRTGRVVFEKNCAICHKIGKMGVNVAPDISDSRTKTPEFLLTNILDPNRAIDNNYFSFTVVDTDGRIHTGVIDTETSTSLTLKQPEGKTVTIARDEIEAIKNNGVSLMPVGLERTITPEQMSDLISFIKNWRYLEGQVPEAVIR